jgi:hypothetical protein
MHSSDSRSLTHALLLDRRTEVAAALETVLPPFAARLEALALYAMVAAFWGVVLFVALSTFLQQ